MSIVFDTSYLNRTENKSPRRASATYRGVVWHETAGSGQNPHTTLKWNLPRSVGSSYDFLIARNGTIYQYLDPDEYTSWDTGASSWTFGGTLYRDWALNEVTLGVELDGPNTGLPCTALQIDAAARLAIYLRDRYNIPLHRAWHVTHYEIAPQRKSDPRGYTVEDVLERAHALLTTPPAPVPVPTGDWLAAWGSVDVDPTWGIPTRYKQDFYAGKSWGMALGPEHTMLDRQIQLFDRAIAVWTANDGVRVYWGEHS